MNDCDYAGFITSAAAATISSIRTANLGRVQVLSEADVAYNMHQSRRATAGLRPPRAPMTRPGEKKRTTRTSDEPPPPRQPKGRSPRPFPPFLLHPPAQGS
eukprot:2993636-Prymnesium_polylepis.1